MNQYTILSTSFGIANRADFRIGLGPISSTKSSVIDNVGRINKRTFLVSTTVLFVAVLLSLCARIFVRVHVQKQFGVDDGCIIFGVIMLITAMGMLYYFVEEMYTAEALMLHYNVPLSYDLIQKSFDFQKWAAVSLIITWAAITAVKLSFLSLFRRLLDRVRLMVVYWWFVLGYTIVVGLYGISAYIMPCPTFYSFQALTCSQGPRLKTTLKYSISQMALDVIGDLLILVIPINIIWRIQIKWTQKVALSFSLCLTVAMIAVTLARASGLVNGDAIDAVWETYWQYLSAEVGLLMSIATAFRAFFVSRSSRRREGENGGRANKSSYYPRAMQRLMSILSIIMHSPFSSRSKQPTSSRSPADGDWERVDEPGALPQVPSATMTGIRTFIGKQGRTNIAPSQIMRSEVVEMEEEWPMSDHASLSKPAP